MPQHSDASPPSLVPELLITDLTTSLRFWVNLCGFEIRYDRPEEGFAYLQLGSAHVMLDQIGLGRDWVTGSLERPLGRGVNFEIAVPSIDSIVEHCAVAGWPLFLEPETRWYRTSDGEIGVRQFLVQDPDGYLLRFTSRVASATP
ncbi:bleomycin resistance protein [Mycetocola zhujimingii]|uniref:Bleomycin resistance protein n=1 Tax=Mycetocola zhujimingii TaxID=2079792 RepID=A0A2U1TB07_9MICO|nr:VOC family protein [Mycetocola zhujimingii]PWC06082.1 bleomycin resistance family protein [Mycetocola zhujimingii]